MVYGGDPANDTSDELRLLIGDTSTGSPVLTDAEVTYYLASSSNIYLAAANAVDALIASDGGSITDKKVGDLQISYALSGGTGGLSALAKKLRMRAARSGGLPYAGGISDADRKVYTDDADRVQPAFTVGGMDNPNSPDVTDEPGVIDW